MSRKGLSTTVWYPVIATTAFTVVMAFSAAISSGGNAWATALISLAIVALLAYLLYLRA